MGEVLIRKDFQIDTTEKELQGEENKGVGSDGETKARGWRRAADGARYRAILSNTSLNGQSTNTKE